MYLDFSTEIILFLVPYNLEMKDWVQFLGSVFFEKNKTTFQSPKQLITLSALKQVIEKILLSLSYNQYLYK